MRNARTWIYTSLLLVVLSTSVRAQDTRNFAMGGVGTAITEGPEAVLWNPALLYFSADQKYTTLSFGTSALDSTNLTDAALDYTDALAAASALPEVRHSREYRGFAGIQVKSYAGGLSHEAKENRNLSDRTAQFLLDRSSGQLSAANYDLSMHQKETRIDTLSLSFAKAMPLGQASAALGSTLKIHQGSRFRQSDWAGAFLAGQPNSVVIDRWSADSGTGFSWDFGAILKPTPNIQLGFVTENINSSYKWKTTHETLGLNTATGLETPLGSTLETLTAPMDHAVRFGIALMSEDRSTVLSSDSRRAQGKTLWRFGYERNWIAQHISIRLGTYRDPVSDRRVISGGAGYLGKTIRIQLAVSGNHWPVAQDSSSFGGAFDLGIKF